MKDILFNIYKYEITKEQYREQDVFPSDKTRVSGSNLECFEKCCLGQKNSMIILSEIISRKNKSNEETIEKNEHKARIIENKNGIAIIEMQAHKEKTMHCSDFTEQPLTDYPPFYIIIDNRPQHQYIAIQHGVMSLDKTTRLLFSTFNDNMAQINHWFEMYKLHKNMSFHDIIFHMKNRLGKSITKIAIEFDKSETHKKLPAKLKHFLKEWVGLFADECKIETPINNDENLQKEEVVQDFQLLSNLCLENPKYKLSAWFGALGVYRYGKEIKAQFGVNAKVLSDYVSQQEPAILSEQKLFSEFNEPEQEALPTLEEWLDKVIIAFDDYEKTAISVTKRNRKRRRAL